MKLATRELGDGTVLGYYLKTNFDKVLRKTVKFDDYTLFEKNIFSRHVAQKWFEFLQNLTQYVIVRHIS